MVGAAISVKSRFHAAAEDGVAVHPHHCTIHQERVSQISKSDSRLLSILSCRGFQKVVDFSDLDLDFKKCTAEYPCVLFQTQFEHNQFVTYSSTKRLIGLISKLEDDERFNHEGGSGRYNIKEEERRFEKEEAVGYTADDEDNRKDVLLNVRARLDAVDSGIDLISQLHDNYLLDDKPTEHQ